MMGRQFEAKYFVACDGVIIVKAPPLKFRERKAIFERDGRKCVQCGVSVRLGGKYSLPWDVVKAGAVDHIFPRCRGGQNTPSNLRMTCQTCNAAKGSKA